jgi:ectoine hydroxylase-related dioxygenase (phytanoyl-CoA dioxygenase family)
VSQTATEAGYSISEPLFDQRRIAALRETLERSDLSRTKAGVRHVLRVPAVRALAIDSSLIGLAASFIGADPIPFRATLFDKSDVSNWLVAWHQDTALPIRQRNGDPAWGPWSIKGGVLHAIAPAAALSLVVALRVHLDDSTSTNGPLRLLPGTHADGVLTHDEIQRRAAAIAPVECIAPAGAVVAMRPLVVHASSKTSDGQPRRVLHIEYTARVHVGSGIELVVG